MKTIIIPTYNEADNIGRLIERIFQYISEGDLEVIVVDDNSTDQTQRIVERLAHDIEGVHLIVRKKKRGLSTAVRRGAQEAKAGPVVVMDADFSHHPRFLPAIFGKLAAGNDVVVGSRYVIGGRVLGWPGSRIAVSKIATYLARILLRVPVKDPLSGFVGCFSPSLLVESIEQAEYKFLVEILAKNRGLQVEEVPIIFQDRIRGESKLDETTILLFLQLLFHLIFGDILNR